MVHCALNEPSTINNERAAAIPPTLERGRLQEPPNLVKSMHQASNGLVWGK
ncbi:MAG: hypothetical protein ICV63_06600 [Coleofasciculus sp. Co-bin14]|nr:hypothetical protein [Coleofasciculus sp. Co-bin14]